MRAQVTTTRWLSLSSGDCTIMLYSISSCTVLYHCILYYSMLGLGVKTIITTLMTIRCRIKYADYRPIKEDSHA